MSAAVKLTPRTKNPNRYSSKEDVNLNKNRYIFSPYETIDCRNKIFGEVPFDIIESGSIHLVSNYTYPIQSEKRIQEEAKRDNEFVPHTRKAGHILDGILRNVQVDGNLKTGVVELTALMGLDAEASREDEELLWDLQQTLYPVLLEDGYAALEWFKSVEGTAKAKGKVFVDTLAQMKAAFTTAIRYNKAVANDLKNQMAQRAKGGESAKGLRGELFDVDERLFRWVREPIPEMTSPFVGGNTSPQPIVMTVPAPASVPQVQCIECGAYANLIVATGLPPKKCQCGAAFEQGEMSEEAKVFQEEEASLSASTPISDDDVEEFDLSTGGKSKEDRNRARRLELQNRK